MQILSASIDYNMVVTLSPAVNTVIIRFTGPIGGTVLHGISDDTVNRDPENRMMTVECRHNRRPSITRHVRRPSRVLLYHKSTDYSINCKV